MIVLGLEGTAHTISAGIIDEERIMSNISSVYKPETGGIHPRDAAIHHSENVILVLRKALSDAGVSMDDVDLIAFSRGPGLGPCLRVVATTARALSLKFNKPIIGVNHPLGHVEIGRRLSGALDPVMLYVSGGNTQVIAHSNGRYRVLGETMDIGLGNMLDKFARYAGIPFPGGPKIESLAKSGKKILDLPYSVKGMDTSFSGIYTASKQYIDNGESLEDVSFSIQETSFSMLVEVLERALYHLNKREILLAGGVARNDRLRTMVEEMAKKNGIKAYLTDKKYCMDNGAMIGQAGFLMYRNGYRNSIEDTSVDQRFRIDEVEVPWIRPDSQEQFIEKGAESEIRHSNYYGRRVIEKIRITKDYRLPLMDNKIRNERMKNEFTILAKLRNNGLSAPIVYDVDKQSKKITMEEIDGITLKRYLKSNTDYGKVISSLGYLVAKMHSARITHGDLTTSNIMVGKQVYFIDPSMGRPVSEPEDMAADIFLLFESFKGVHSELNDLHKIFSDSYKNSYPDSEKIMDLMHRIEKRRRYV